ncbi:MAG: DUF1622 domain-containing protein [Alphaproteobacteria bacterium]|nr:DUF1622 domain-containing protein [Alphaproteobacteria bacterium]
MTELLNIDIQATFLNLLNMIVTIINLVGVMIVIWGFVVAALAFIHLKRHHHTTLFFLKEANTIRAVLGTYILFGLEFMIAADIIHTFIKPTQEDLIVLATIVAIRTVISYFLGREVDEARHDQDLAHRLKHSKEVNQ